MIILIIVKMIKDNDAVIMTSGKAIIMMRIYHVIFSELTINCAVVDFLLTYNL